MCVWYQAGPVGRVPSGRRPDHAELLESPCPLAGHLPGPVRPSLFRDPLSKRCRTLFVSIWHSGVPLAFGELLECRPAACPVLAFGVDHVEADPVRDHHRIPGGGKTQQQPGFFLALFWRDTDVHGRLRHVLLRLLRNREQFHGFFVVSAQTFQYLHQRAIRSRGEHVLRLFSGLEEYRHDQRGELAFSWLLTERPADGLDDVVRSTLGVQQGNAVHRSDVHALAQDTAVGEHGPLRRGPERAEDFPPAFGDVLAAQPVGPDPSGVLLGLISVQLRGHPLQALRVRLGLDGPVVEGDARLEVVLRHGVQERGLQGPEPLTAHLFRVSFLAHQLLRGDDRVLQLQHDDLIPRQQAPGDGRCERELVQDGPEDLLVVHGSRHLPRQRIPHPLGNLAVEPLLPDPRRRRQVKPPVRRDNALVVDVRPRLTHRTRRTVRLVRFSCDVCVCMAADLLLCMWTVCGVLWCGTPQSCQISTSSKTLRPWENVQLVDPCRSRVYPSDRSGSRFSYSLSISRWTSAKARSSAAAAWSSVSKARL
ncbi:hypothetical protein SUDANB51_08143 (plasmid) [Streptomyces sp. enrichment culture]